MATAVKSGGFVPHVQAFGLESGVVKYVANPRLDSLVPSALKARMTAASDSMAKGTLVPAARPTVMEASAMRVRP